MKCSFGISNFLDEISSLSQSIVFLLKNLVKYTHEKLDERIHRLKPGKFSGAETSVSVKLGYIILMVPRCVHRPGNSLNPLLRFIWRFHHTGIIDH